MSQEKSSTSLQTVFCQIMPTVSMACNKTPSTETEKTPLKSINIVTSQIAHVNCNYHPPIPTPTNQPHTNQPPTNPILFPSWDWGQTQNQGGAPSWDWAQTQNQGGAPSWDWRQTQKKGGAPGGDGDKPKTKEVPNVGMGEKPKKNDIPKVGMGEVPIVPFEQPPQRNIKFEQDRKRSSMDTDGKNPHENKRVHKDACVSDLVWPICKIDNTEYSK